MKARGQSLGKIIYPFRISPDDLYTEEMFMAYQSVPYGYDPKGQKVLLKSFVEAHMQDGDVSDLVWGTGDFGRQPVYAIECNTYEGHSGSPVFSKDVRQIVGIFLGGKGAGRKKPAVWPEMEFVLPIRPVIDQLDKENPGWQQKYGVQVVNDIAPKASANFSTRTLIAKRSP
jgi:hypothetical protein